MAGITDYSTNPDLNTTVGGVFIGEFCPAANLNNGIRAEMADTATAFGGGAAGLTDLAVMTATNKYTTPQSFALAFAPQTLVDGATVALDLGTGAIFTLNKTQNGAMTIANGIIGRTYLVAITQDATGNRTLSKPTVTGGTVLVRGGWPGLSTAGNTLDLFSITRLTSAIYLITPSKGYTA